MTIFYIFKLKPSCAARGNVVFAFSGEIKLRCEGRDYAKTAHDYYIRHNFHSALMFILQSEGRSFCTLNKIFGGLLCNEWRGDDQHPLVNLRYCNVQDKDFDDHTLFCGSSDHFFFFSEISYIPEERYVFSKLNPYTRTSQRPPPLIKN